MWEKVKRAQCLSIIRWKGGGCEGKKNGGRNMEGAKHENRSLSVLKFPMSRYMPPPRPDARTKRVCIISYIIDDETLCQSLS